MNVLKHLSIIMDGNGRWAQKRNLNRAQGHLAGSRKAFEIIDCVANMQISTLSLFAFSVENWQRPQSEVDLLMKLLAHSLKRKRKFLAERNIRLKVIGDRKQLPDSVVKAIEEVELTTAMNTGLELILAVNYSGQYDICQAVQKASKSGLDLTTLAIGDFEKFLTTASFHNPDLLIRTGGETRLSNFFLWQSAYSEIHFEPKYWPDYTIQDLQRQLGAFTVTERRYGKTSAQLLER
jgi:undecaprenyl diphosphate synthase